MFGGALRNIFPERWDQPLAIGLGVVVVQLVGNTVKSYINQFVPAAWLDPVAEIIIGIGLWAVGSYMGIGWFKWMSYGALAIGIADGIGIATGIGASPIVGIIHKAPTHAASGPTGTGVRFT